MLQRATAFLSLCFSKEDEFVYPQERFMTAFTFEYFRKGEAPILREKIEISNPAAIWLHVEALALRAGESPGAFIRVRDERGQVVVRAGVATALVAIEQCPCGCELKEILRGGKKFDGLPLSPCKTLSSRLCKALAPSAH
jgi:hypothetical protein